MKYFLDTEFISGRRYRAYGAASPTIDLISIGLVSENGDKYYAISKEFNLKWAWTSYETQECCKAPIMCGTYKGVEFAGNKKTYWIRDNVLWPIYRDYIIDPNNSEAPFINSPFTYQNMKKVLDKIGRTRYQIANDICAFIFGDDCGGSGMSALEMSVRYEPSADFDRPEFYAYYAAYDWVVFCWIFGNMNELPKGFPQYCRDLKQMLDEHKLDNAWVESNCPKPKFLHQALNDAEWDLSLFNSIQNYLNNARQA